MVVVLPIQELPNTVFGCFSTTVVQELPTRIFGCFSTCARITNRIFGCFSTSTRITEQNLWLWFFKQNLWLFNCQYKNYKTDFCFQSVENEFSLWSRTKTGALVIQRRYSSQVGKINSMTCNRATSVHTVYSVQDPNLIIKFQKSKYTVYCILYSILYTVYCSLAGLNLRQFCEKAIHPVSWFKDLGSVYNTIHLRFKVSIAI